MKSLYLLLTRSESFLSGIIRLATDDPYTHVSVAFDDDLYHFYSFGRKYALLPYPAGMVAECPDGGFFGRHGDMPCALLELQVTDEAYAQARRITGQMWAEAGRYRYSLLGLILCRLGVPRERPNHYFCSQFVGRLLRESGAITLPKPPSLMRPVDYDGMPETVCLYRGPLRNLPRPLPCPAPCFRSAVCHM